MATLKSCYYSLCWIATLILLEFVDCQQYIGDFCTLQSTGASGQCQVITNCPSAIQALQSQGVPPQTCGFLGTQPIVCCAGSSPTTKPTTTRSTPRVTPPTLTPTRTPPTVRTPPSPKQPLLVGDKSRAKCKEYVQYIYRTVVAGGSPQPDCYVEADVQLIVGGEKAKAKEFPHMALIGFDGENNEKAWQCGGSLISEQFVLTAGHCLFHKQFGESKYIRIGELDLGTESDDADPQDFTIIERIRHPDYRPPSQYNDIALVKMNKKADLNPYARPACLNTDSTLDLTIKPRASGWGKIGYSEATSKTLLKVSLEYFTIAECNYSYRNDIGIRLRNGIIDDTQVCAGSHEEPKDTCQGDSGGPLQVKHPTEECMYKIIGITSFGKACGVASIPGVYTRVSKYIEWIEGIVWP